MLAVLRQVDAARRRADDGDAVGLQLESQIEGSLPAELDDDALGPLVLDDVEDVLDCEGLEVELVRRVVVGAHRLRVGVDHDRLEAVLAEGEAGVDAAVVELDSLADPVGPAPEDHHLAAPGPGLRLVLPFVRGVVVRRVGLELGGAGVDGLEHGAHALLPSRLPDLRLGAPRQVTQLAVAEAQGLGRPQTLPVPKEPLSRLPQIALGLEDLGQAVDEPGIDAAEAMDLFGGEALVQGGIEMEQPLRARTGQVAADLGVRNLQGFLDLAVSAPAAPADLQRPQALLEGLRKGAAHGHRLSHRAHLGVEGVRRGWELLEGPPRNLGHHVVDGGLEGGGRLPGDVVGDLVEGVPHGQLGGDLGDGEARGLGRQGGAARDPGIHLDDHHAARLRVDGELDVRPARVDADLPDDPDGGIAHGLVLLVGQGLRRSDSDRIARVHPHGIEILDGADDDDIVVQVAHHLELELLPAENGLLYQDLRNRTQIEAPPDDALELLRVVRDPATRPAQGVGGPNDGRIAQAVDQSRGLFDGVDEMPGGHFQPRLVHRLLEQLPILRRADRLEPGPDQLHAVLFEHPGLGQLHRPVQSRLSAHGGQEGIRSLDLDDLGAGLGGDGLHVGPVRRLRVGHDRGGIAVDEDDLVALLAQGLAGLRAGVVELTGLADDDRTGTDEHDLVQVVSTRHARGSPHPWVRRQQMVGRRKVGQCRDRPAGYGESRSTLGTPARILDCTAPGRRT